METTHLDLGCGQFPRNPYNQNYLYGTDTREIEWQNISNKINFKQSNFALEPLPFSDDQFDSVSAFDVIEHIPRQIMRDGSITYPFIDLMSDIHRVLKPGGLFLALTPAYPHPEAFQDPTHVNFITLKTAEYFCGEKPLGKIYGFKGKFSIKTNRYDVRSNFYDAKISPIKSSIKRWHRRLFKGGSPHIAWELIAIK